MKLFSFKLCELVCLLQLKNVQVTIIKEKKFLSCLTTFYFRKNSLSSVLFVVKRKLVRFSEAQIECGDRLYFRKRYSLAPQFHCNGLRRTEEIWNDEFSTYAYDFLEIIYQPIYGSAGGKFWLAVEGEYSSSVSRDG